MKTARQLAQVLFLAFFALTLVACFPGSDSDVDAGNPIVDGGTDGGGGGDGGPTCQANEVRTCTCPDASEGLEACLPSGEWGSCECVADCGPGEHDGGDGTCVPDGQCSAGYHDGGTGRCVPAGLCETGYHDGGAGTCVPTGLCETGYHDGGSGDCVVEGACSTGYRPASTGACIPLVDCSEGLNVTPAQAQFGDVPVGETRSLSLVFTNPATFDPCPISGIDLAAGTAATFSIVGGAPGPQTLAPGASVGVEVLFAPVAADSSSGFLTAVYTGGVSTVRLLGQGLDIAASVSPLSHDFGAVAFPCAEAQGTICVSNDGGIAMQVTQATIAGSSDFSVTSGPSLPAPLAVGTTTCFGITYVPGAVGTSTGSLELTLVPGGLRFSVPLAGEGAAQGTATDTYLQSASAKADILWVIDNSCSMQEEQTSLASQAPQLISYLDQQGVDYQLAVVSTDATSPFPNVTGLMEPQTRSRPHIVTPLTTDPAVVFGQNVQLGTQGSATETGFETARAALSDPLISDPAGNHGFIRSDAYLSIIFVSDEVEQSADTEQTFLDFFTGIHGATRPDLFIASSFAGPPPSGCSSGTANAVYTPRYWNIAQVTGGATSSICNPDWSVAMQAIASGFDLVSRFPLSEEADVTGTFLVFISDGSGTSTPATGWSYDPTANAIDFAAGSVPQPGETIEITYTTICQ